MSWRSQVAFWKARRLGLVQPDTTPTPTATSCSPSQAMTTGGTSIVITGTRFMSEAPRPDAGVSFVENVYFGLLLATSFTVNSATQITAVAPAQAAGPVTVVVNTSGGCAVVINGVTYGSTVATFRILTEAGDPILTEASDYLRTE